MRILWLVAALAAALLVVLQSLGVDRAWSEAPPVVQIESPADGSTLTGTVAAVNGSAVIEAPIGSIEVSGDGGVTWGAAAVTFTELTSTVRWSYDLTLPRDDNTTLHPLTVRATDTLAGTAETTATVRIDNTPPVVTSFYIADDAEYASTPDVVLTLAATDGSPPLQMQLRNADGSWDPWQDYAQIVPWTLPAGDGPKEVQVRVRDALGNATTGTISDSITLLSESPTILGTMPAGLATGVNPGATLHVLFSQPMDATTIDANSIQLWRDVDANGAFSPADLLESADVSYDTVSRSASVRPAEPMAAESVFFLRVLGEVSGASGVPLGAGTEFVVTFRTGTPSAAQPQALSLTPPDGASGVLVTTDIVMEFDREMQWDSLAAGVTLKDADTQMLVLGELEADPSISGRVRFIPYRPLSISTTYVFTVAGSVLDYYGNSLGADVTSTFTTSDVGVNPHGTYNTGTDICSLCHAVHLAPQITGFGGSLLQAGSETELCYTCHNGTGARSNVEENFALMGSGHVVDDVIGAIGAGLTSTCSSCHEPHALESDTPTLHRSMINNVEVKTDDYTWCEACHDDASSWYGSDYPYPTGEIVPTGPPKPVRAADGYPDKGTFPGATVYNNTLTNPHNPTTSTNVVWPDSGLPSGDCRNCHGGHRTASLRDGLVAQFRPTPAPTPENPNAVVDDRRTGAYAELCLTCHDLDGPATTDIKSFVTFAAEDAGATGGHRIVTPGGTLPVGAPLPCYDCHNPHGSAGRDGAHPNSSLLSDELWSGVDTSTTAGEVIFCLQCHLPWEYANGSGEPEAGTVPGGQAETIEGLDRRDPINRLSLPNTVEAHGKANRNDPTIACGSCHGNDYTSPSVDSGYNVHRPQGTGGYEAALHTATPGSGDILMWNAGEHDSAMVGDGYVIGVDCTLCHNPEFVPGHDWRCASCHPSPVDSLTPSWSGGCQQGDCHTVFHPDSRAHWPVEDQCTACHTQADWLVRVSSCQNCHALFSPAGDTIPPVTSSDAEPSYVGPGRISFSVSEGGKVGVGFTYYQVDGGVVETGNSAVVSGTGAHTIRFWSVDQYGNKEDPPKSAAYTIAADTTAPVTTSDAKAAYYPTTLNMASATARIRLTGTDSSSLGVKTTYYALDGGPTQTGTMVTVPPPATGTASHTLEFWSEDYSGNVEARNSVAFSITVGTGTIRLVWGDSDTTGPPSDPGSAADWTIRRGSWTGPIVASGSGAYPGWDGVDDYLFPLNPTFSYFVRINWWDTVDGFWDQTDFAGVVIDTDGQVERLSY